MGGERGRGEEGENVDIFLVLCFACSKDVLIEKLYLFSASGSLMT